MNEQSDNTITRHNTQPVSGSRLEYTEMLLDNVSDAIISFDREKIITFWNKGAERIYGWTKEEAIGQDGASLLRSEAPESVRNSRLMKAEEQGELQVEAVHYTKDNKRITVLSNVIPIKETSGKITGYTAVNRDITHSRKIEGDLKDSENRYSALFNNKTNAIAHCRTILDDTGTPVDYEIIHINEAYTNVTGLRKEQIEGRRAREVFPGIENFTFDYIGEYGKVALHGGELNFEVFFESLQQWLSIYVYSPMHGEFTAIFTDISARKNAEEALKTSESRLLDAQKMAHLCSFTFDLVENRFDWTDEFFNIFEIEKAAFSYPQLLALVHPEDRDYIVTNVSGAIEQKKDTLQMEYRIITGRGNIKYMHYRGKLYYNSAGVHTKRFGTILDITERKLQELELKKTMEELERSNKELEQFAYVSSHDLQEPIRMVSMYTRLLEIELKESLNEKTRQYMFFVTDGARRMHNLIQDLLAYSRVSSNNEDFIITDLNEVMAEVLRDLQVAITDHHAEILCTRLPVINAYPSQIRLVFQNLVQNAIKFRSSANPLIQITADRNGKEWLFCVKDNGIGIDPEFHEKIFIIFKRMHEKELYPGTGIGLSICKKIIERHEGRIWVESELGKGAAFYFTLPV